MRSRSTMKKRKRKFVKLKKINIKKELGKMEESDFI